MERGHPDHESLEIGPPSSRALRIEQDSDVYGSELAESRTACWHVLKSATWTTNPATGQPWTQAEVNALQAGVELASTNWIVRVTQVYVTVRVNGQDVVLRPNGPGALSGWTKSGSGGANWDRVKEGPAQDGDTSYVYATVPGTSDLYALGDLAQAGPISQVTVTALVRTPPNCESTPCQGSIRLLAGVPPPTYAYADGSTGMNTLTSITRNGNTTSFAWDANGNLDTKTGGWDYDWNPENLMTVAKLNGVPQQTYTYDGFGRRVKVDGVAGSGSWTVSIVSGMDVIFEKTNTGAITKYVYANGMRIAKINPDNTVHYFLSDHQSSTRKILDASRNTVYSVEYEPFGKPYSVSGPKPDSHKYTMERHDDPTGLVYLRARQYDPEIGRFVSADPVLGVTALPQTLNRYAYVVNNPMKFTDPTGEFLSITFGFDVVNLARECWDKGLTVEGARCAGDPIMTAVGFVPIVGDIASTAWFVGWDLYDCTQGRCDLGMLALDAAGIIPGVPNLGSGARIFARIAGALPLPAIFGFVKHGDEALDLSRGLSHGANDLPRVVRGTGYAGEVSRLMKNTVYLRLSPDSKQVWHVIRYDEEGRMMWRLDLVGKPHYDKVSRTYVQTPHFHILYDPVTHSWVDRVVPFYRTGPWR